MAHESRAVHMQHHRQSAVAIDYRVSETEKSKFYFTKMQFPCAANRFECVCAQDQEMHLIKWAYHTHCTSLNRAKSMEPITCKRCDCAKWNIFKAFSSWKYGTTANARKKQKKSGFFPLNAFLGLCFVRLQMHYSSLIHGVNYGLMMKCYDFIWYS